MKLLPLAFCFSLIIGCGKTSDFSAANVNLSGRASQAPESDAIAQNNNEKKSPIINLRDEIYYRESTLQGYQSAAGIPSAACSAGDTIIGVVEANCSNRRTGGTFDGILETVAIHGNSASIGCDEGNDAFYDGGYIKVSCLKGGGSGAAQIQSTYERTMAPPNLVDERSPLINKVNGADLGPVVASCDAGDRLLMPSRIDCNGDYVGSHGRLNYFLGTGSSMALSCSDNTGNKWGGRVTAKCLKASDALNSMFYEVSRAAGNTAPLQCQNNDLIVSVTSAHCPNNGTSLSWYSASKACSGGVTKILCVKSDNL